MNLILIMSKNIIRIQSIYFCKEQKINHYQIIQDLSGINNPYRALLPVILCLFSIPKDGVTFKCNQNNLEAKVKNCEFFI